MQFLKTLFWVVVAVAAAVFAMRNWTVVPVYLWGGLRADVKLPVLLAAFFLLGWAPLYLWHVGRRWHYRRRIDSVERSLAELRPAEVPPVTSAVDALPEGMPLPAPATSASPLIP